MEEVEVLRVVVRESMSMGLMKEFFLGLSECTHQIMSSQMTV